MMNIINIINILNIFKYNKIICVHTYIFNECICGGLAW